MGGKGGNGGKVKKMEGEMEMGRKVKEIEERRERKGEKHRD